MRRNVLFMLLLAMGALPAGAQINTDAPQVQRQEVRAKAEEPQDQNEEAQAQTEEPKAQTEKDAKVISGMSILGNQEAPKSLVIVPWKGSEIGTSVDISTMLDDSRQPVDKEVFMRELRYYKIRSEKKP